MTAHRRHRDMTDMPVDLTTGAGLRNRSCPTRRSRQFRPHLVASPAALTKLFTSQRRRYG